MTMQPVATADPADAVALLSGEAPRLVFKHSPSCWISRRAYTQVSEFADAHPELPVLVVDVLAQRALSQQIAAELQVPHASPQVILVANGGALWNASHGGVTMQAIERALSSQLPAQP